jgi:hypothetical protein
MYELIDAIELAKRWNVPVTWIRNHVRTGYTTAPIPHVQLGRYVRFEWASPTLEHWLAKRREGGQHA